MGHAIDWDTAKVHLTDQARLVLTVRLAVDPILIVEGEAVPNPIWREKFNRAASARRHEWQARNLHWGTPEVDPGGTITVAPIDTSTSVAALLPGALDDLVKPADEHEGGEWKRLEIEAGELTQIFRSST
jgi:hypothetical protein